MGATKPTYLTQENVRMRTTSAYMSLSLRSVLRIFAQMGFLASSGAVSEGEGSKRSMRPLALILGHSSESKLVVVVGNLLMKSWRNATH